MNWVSLGSSGFLCVSHVLPRDGGEGGRVQEGGGDVVLASGWTNLGVPGCGRNMGWVSLGSSGFLCASPCFPETEEREGEFRRVVEMLRWHRGGRIWVCLGVGAIREME